MRHKLMRILTLAIMSLVCFFAASLSAADDIFAKDGNLYFINTQITTSGKDRLAILSVDKKIVAFVRTGDALIPEDCKNVDTTESKYADQIWIYSIEEKKEYLIVASKLTCDKPEDLIARVNELKFSPDHKIIYFLTSAWEASSALHAVNIDGRAQHYLVSALSFDVILQGKSQGYLIIKQRRYFSDGQSFDWYWLFTSNGKEVAAIGPEIPDTQKESIEPTE